MEQACSQAAFSFGSFAIGHISHEQMTLPKNLIARLLASRWLSRYDTLAYCENKPDNKAEPIRNVSDQLSTAITALQIAH